MTKQNNKTDHDMGIALFLATIWLIIAGYLISLPVEANQTSLTQCK